MAAAPPAMFALPRARRIKEGRDFSRARTEGKRLVQGCMILNWLPLPSGAVSRVGVITGRKLGNAVTRNRARRLLRESFRLHQQHLLSPVDLVLVARPSIVGGKFCDVESDFLAGLRRAKLLKE